MPTSPGPPGLAAGLRREGTAMFAHPERRNTEHENPHTFLRTGSARDLALLLGWRAGLGR